MTDKLSEVVARLRPILADIKRAQADGIVNWQSRVFPARMDRWVEAIQALLETVENRRDKNRASPDEGENGGSPLHYQPSQQRLASEGKAPG